MNDHPRNNENSFPVTESNHTYRRTDKVLTTTSSPVIGIPAINPKKPGSNQSITVSSYMAASNGIKNATLFWRYSTLNDTVFNTTMSGDTTQFIDLVPNSRFPTRGFITASGDRTDVPQHWKYGEYIYQAAAGELISEIDLAITASGSNIVYVLIEARNYTTGEWDIAFEKGNIGGTTDHAPVAYHANNLTSGYKIFAITYKSSNLDPAEPVLGRLWMFRSEYIADIPAPNEPSFIECWIQVFDTLDNQETSAIHTLLADWKPLVAINNLPVALESDQDYTINVTVTDYDNISTVNDVTAYYRLEHENEWNQVSLTFIRNTSLISAYYEGSVPGVIVDQETTLLLMVNASDTVGGQKGYEGSSGTVNIFVNAPLLEKLLISPSVISNITDVSVFFNVSDDSTGFNVTDSVIWYSFDNGTTWNSTVAALIDYAAHVDYNQTIAINNAIPLNISDNSTTYLSLEVIRNITVDSANLTVSFSHENTTDLRIWLVLENGSRFLIFDRMAGTGNVTITADLFALGLVQSDFDSGNFTLEVQDLSATNTGSITAFQVDLYHHDLPQGYEFLGTIPPTGNDTTVIFYITLMDGLLNAKNTSTFTYYSDGLPPDISVQEIPSPLDMEQGSYIQVVANVTDAGGIQIVQIYYKFSENGTWQIQKMLLNPETEQYLFDIPLPVTSGKVFYKINASDLVEHTSETLIYIIEFSNAKIAGTSTKNPGIDPLMAVLAVLGLAGVAVSAIIIRGRFRSGSGGSIAHKIPRDEYFENL
ncbi:MAG: proprotein convertase P-domain-containing protein [Candidatus Odinarchaeota archaeon]